MFDGEHEITRHEMQGNHDSYSAKGKSHGFSRVAMGTWGIFSSYCGDGLSKLVFAQRHQYYCLGTRDTSRISTSLGRAIRTLLKVRWKTKCPFLVATVILGFLSIFKKSQGSSPFEALNLAHLSKSQMDVGPSVQKRLRTMAFSSVSTGDSDIPSFYEMQDEPAFKALQGKPAFF